MASGSAIAPDLVALVAGTAHYPKSNGKLDELHAVESEVAVVANVLATEYAARLLDDGGIDRDSASLLQAILNVLGEEAQSEGQLSPLVVYLSGHGLEGVGDYYICTSDTDPSPVWLPRSSMPMKQLAEILGHGNGREIVVVIDACQSEIGIEHIASFSLENRISGRRVGTVWGIAATSRVEEAGQLEFATAFADALRKPQVRRSQPYLQIAELIDQINRDRDNELACAIPGTSIRGISKVFQNPFYSGRLPLVPERALRLFGGRRQARRDLLQFARAEGADQQAVVVVSGGSGSGKSMMLSVLKNDLDEAGTANVVIDARGRGAKDLTTELFDELGIVRPPLPSDRIVALQDCPDEIVVLVDAPESMEEDDRDLFIADVLLPLAQRPGRLKLVLGSATVPDLLRDLAQEIDLDSEAYFVPDDLIDLAVKVLTAEGSGLTGKDGAEVRRLARWVGVQSGRSFRTADDLASWRARDPLTKEEDMPILVERIALRLKALNLNPDRTMGLLAPLAFAEGPGIPDFGLWLDVAKQSAGMDYTSEELVALLDALDTDLVTEAYAEPEQACWRMASDELVAELRRGRHLELMHAAFTDALLAAVPQLPSGTRQWELATEYTRRHLAIHAAKAGRLTGLLDDPGFLLITDISRTKRALYLEDSRASHPAESPSRSTLVRRLLEALAPADRADEVDRAGQLAYLAHVAGLDSLASRADKLPASWRTVWAAQADAPRATRLADHVVGNAELLVIGGYDGSVSFHRLGGETTAFDKRMSGMVTGLAVGRVDGRDVVLAGDFDGDVRLYDFGDLSARDIATNCGSVIGCAIVDGRLLVGTMTGWALYSTADEIELEVDTGEPQFSVFATGTIGSEPVVVLGGPSAVWSLRTGRSMALPAVEPGRGYWPTAITMCSSSGEIVVGYQNGEVLAFTGDGQRRRLAGHEGNKVSAVLLAGAGPTRQLLSAGHDGRVRRTPLGADAPPAAAMDVAEHLDDLVIGSSGWLAIAASGRGGAVLEWREGQML
ncbi:caspase family protein [Kribbella sp. NBC_00709]|uniref:caspase family protein n=1 Tax=Kribbella sp. NBC_00709 TaxID=2975972 RepID=UPI002E2A176D|nr:caspase family protein [Kribbella sp. NBC_00709]